MSESDAVEKLRAVALKIRKARESGSTALLSDELKFLACATLLAEFGCGQLSQDIWALYETKFARGGYFVEFGAGDGKLLSNTFLLEKEFGWTGALAEPNPGFQTQLRGNRNCFVSQKCVAPGTGETAEFVLSQDPHLSTLAKYASGDHHAASRVSGTKIPVETISLNDLLREARAPRTIDYLSIDTEGSEFDILSTFDFDAYDIGLMTVEHNFTPRREALHDLLTAKGFVRKFVQLSEFDDWYVKR